MPKSQMDAQARMPKSRPCGQESSICSSGQPGRPRGQLCGRFQIIKYNFSPLPVWIPRNLTPLQSQDLHTVLLLLLFNSIIGVSTSTSYGNNLTRSSIRMANISSDISWTRGLDKVRFVTQQPRDEEKGNSTIRITTLCHVSFFSNVQCSANLLNVKFCSIKVVFFLARFSLKICSRYIFNPKFYSN